MSRKRVVRQGPGVCVWCGRRVYSAGSIETRLDPGLLATAEHLVPRYRGGGEGENLAVACVRCNSLRGHTPLAVWRPFARQVVRRYPQAPSKLLKGALREYTDQIVEEASKNEALLRRCLGVAVLYFDDISKDVV